MKKNILLLFASGLLAASVTTNSFSQRSVNDSALRDDHGRGAIRHRPPPPIIDNDQDSIDDNTEHALLERFRPYYMFSKDNGPEDFAPTDVLWYISKAVLLADNDDPYTPNQVLASNQDIILNPPHFIHGVQVNSTPVSEDITVTHSSTQNNIHLSVIGHYSHANGAYITPENSPNIHGNPWQDVRGNQNIVLNGFYGHVVPVRLLNPDFFSFDAVNSDYKRGNLYYKIEYWQFFAFNSVDKPANFGDHEGDWCSVQLLYDPVNDKIITTFHFAHGFCFEYHMSQTVTTVMGTNMDGNLKEFQGINYSKNIDLVKHDALDLAHHRDDSLRAQSNILRMFQDKQTLEFAHPIVYIERGSHEFYPSEYWDYYGAPSHNGKDTEHNFLTTTPPNLGEVEHPLSETNGALVVLRYNGYWGAYDHDNTPPMGPSLHQEFTWPASSSIRWLLPAWLGF